MGQFLRFALLIILVFIGFGTGVCGLFAIGSMAVDTMSRSSGMDQYAPLIFGLGAICIAVAVGCFFGVRALHAAAHALECAGRSRPRPATGSAAAARP
jgi:amino acid transporter